MRPDGRLVQLVQLLSTISNTRKFEWARTSDDDALRMMLSGGALLIKRLGPPLTIPPGEAKKYVPVYSIAVRDRGGALVVGGEDDTYTAGEFPALADLYEQASSNFQDRALQRIMDELRDRPVAK